MGLTSGPTVLVLGATGLLGRTALYVLAGRFAVIGTTQRSEDRALDCSPVKFRFGVQAHRFETIAHVLQSVQPSAVVNCIGVIKQRVTAESAEMTEYVNGVFPHKLASLCLERGIRLIHISTDCVFSGRRGMYVESDPPDPVDLYGRSKLLGEPTTPSCLTLRTSFVGRERGTAYGLVEWLRSHRGGTVQGFRGAKFSGVTATVLARLIGGLVDKHTQLSGVWHVAGESIDKFSLLNLVNDEMRLGVTIQPDDSVKCDRSLDGSAFAAMTGFCAPTWGEMVAELAQEFDHVQ